MRLRGVVDDDGEVVGGYAVVAAEDEVVDPAVGRSVQRVDELDHLAVGAQPQCRRPAARLALGALVVGQIAARARVGAVGIVAVWGDGRLADLAAGAVAGVGEPGPLELGDDGSVAVEPLATGGRPRRRGRGRSRPGRSAGRPRVSGEEVTRSRSSIRTMKREPVDRANSHATIAVRRLPRWRAPVGLGAKRPSGMDQQTRTDAPGARR